MHSSFFGAKVSSAKEKTCRGETGTKNDSWFVETVKNSMLVERIASNWNCGRFAPSTTGRVHPGTLLAGLLCWLDARSTGGQVRLRLEDLDRERTKPGYVDQMKRDLEWFGLEWDACSLQSENGERHEAVLESLVAKGHVYACDCSRSEIRSGGRRTPDGGACYPGTCRAQIVSRASWRTIDRPLRLRIESEEISLVDESGLNLSGDAARLFGDPILRRRDGAFSYQIASVADDGEAGVDRVVRGRDLAASTILQVAIQKMLGLPTPAYRHHLLFLERTGDKYSKLHGAIGLDALRSRMEAREICGQLAAFVGLVPVGTACRPEDLISIFGWDRVRTQDISVEWDPERGLTLGSNSEAADRS